MKKYLVILIILIVGAAFAQDPDNPGAAKPRIYGDLNGDSLVDQSDVGLLKRYLSGKLHVPVKYRDFWPEMDINRDCKNTKADITYLTRYIAGKNKEPLPQNCHKNFKPTRGRK
jgi:hypothetical protein